MFNCLVCGKPVKDYKPDYCCSGNRCACKGLPLNPCVCSEKCEEAVFRFSAVRIPNKPKHKQEEKIDGRNG